MKITFGDGYFVVKQRFTYSVRREGNSLKLTEHEDKKAFMPSDKSKVIARRWVSCVLCHVRKFFFVKQWQPWLIWVCYSCTCYPSERITSWMSCSRKMVHLHNGLLISENFSFYRGWVGRDWPIPRPPHSPDVTLLGFLIWVYFNSIVYKTLWPPSMKWNSGNFRSDETVALQTLRNTWKEIPYHLDTST